MALKINDENAKELIAQAYDIVEPLPYNYRNAQKSGWVE